MINICYPILNNSKKLLYPKLNFLENIVNWKWFNFENLNWWMTKILICYGNLHLFFISLVPYKEIKIIYFHILKTIIYCWMINSQTKIITFRIRIRFQFLFLFLKDNWIKLRIVDFMIYEKLCWGVRMWQNYILLSFTKRILKSSEEK